MAYKKQRVGRKKVCYFTKNNIWEILFITFFDSWEFMR